MRRNYLIKVFCIISLVLLVDVGNAANVRIKDIGKILEARDNQIMGFGLVVGLKNTGDSSRTEFTKIALGNLLNNMDITSLSDSSFKSKNVAAVMITAVQPSFLKPGQRIDVAVSSLGDARSLKGGTLLLSPLKAADGNVYAVAQGALVVGGIDESSAETVYARNQTTVGRINGGAIIEKEVHVDLTSKKYLTIVLNSPDFTNASRVSYAINSSGMARSKAKDASTIVVELTDDYKQNIVDFISRIEKLSINPDAIAKIVISERTGTIVIGENVKLTAVAVTHGQISVKIDNDELLHQTNIKVYEKPSKLVQVSSGANLASLVKALNAIGTTPQDLISILQAIKKAGALTAEIEII